MVLCYLCGHDLKKRKDRNKDHIPPYCIFPDPKPLNLITVYCCEDCHQKFTVLDERMRNYIAILAGDKSGKIGKKAMEVVLRSNKLRNDFLQHTKPHPSQTDDAGRPRRLFYFTDEELRQWLIRLVKGLFFYQNKRIIGDGFTYEVKAKSDITPQDSSTFPMEEGLRLRPYFVYGVVQSPNNDFWVLIFYDHLVFTVSVDSPVLLSSPCTLVVPGI